jgi:hypothetical protein
MKEPIMAHEGSDLPGWRSYGRPISYSEWHLLEGDKIAARAFFIGPIVSPTLMNTAKKMLKSNEI